MGPGAFARAQRPLRARLASQMPFVRCGHRDVRQLWLSVFVPVWEVGLKVLLESNHGMAACTVQIIVFAFINLLGDRGGTGFPFPL